LPQLDALLELGEREVYVDFADIRQYAEAVHRGAAARAAIWPATPRICKPGEQGIFKLMARAAPAGVLVRNLAALAFFTAERIPCTADYSLNATNELSVDWLRRQGVRCVTAAYDLNREQLLSLVDAVPADWLEIVIHQHMPLFHMEHCVFCAVLSPGTNKTNCGRPCDRHEVKLRDRVGAEHPLTADVGCRNTLYNATPQSAAEAVPALRARGVQRFRIEFLEGETALLRTTLALYRELLGGRVSGEDVWRRLRALNRVGVTRGTLETSRDPLAIL
jgi:putative protease